MLAFLVVLVLTSLTLHYAFSALGLLPSPESAKAITERTYFALDYTLGLNALFLILSGGFVAWTYREDGKESSRGVGERVLLGISALAAAWLLGGLALSLAGFGHY